MTFKKGKRISNIFYYLAVIIAALVIMGYIPVGIYKTLAITAIIILVCIGIALYWKWCSCPACGKVQPRTAGTKCAYCDAELKREKTSK